MNFPVICLSSIDELFKLEDLPSDPTFYFLRTSNPSLNGIYIQDLTISLIHNNIIYLIRGEIINGFNGHISKEQEQKSISIAKTIRKKIDSNFPDCMILNGMPAISPDLQIIKTSFEHILQ